MRILGRVGHYVGRRPLHVGTQRRAKLRIIGQLRVIGGPHEAGDEAFAKVTMRPLAGVDADHPGVTAALARKPLRPTENLGPIGGKPLDVPGVTGMGEGMAQDGVGKAALMMRRRQRQKGGITARELEQRGTRHAMYVNAMSAIAF